MVFIRVCVRTGPLACLARSPGEIAQMHVLSATRVFSASLVPRDGLIDSLMHPGNPAPSLKINDGSAIDESATTTVAMRRADIRRLAELR